MNCSRPWIDGVADPVSPLCVLNAVFTSFMVMSLCLLSYSAVHAKGCVYVIALYVCVLISVIIY